MEILRDIYLNKLIQRKNNHLVKVITGIRRCGKSYLLNCLFRNHLLQSGVPEDHILSMAFDDYENKGYRDPEAFYVYIRGRMIDEQTYYILLDEVQLLRDFEEVLNGLLYKRNADIYVTGSNAKFLSKDVITEFRGRGDEIHMYPLSFSEFMSVFDGEKSDGLKSYMLYGGLPSVVLIPDSDRKAEYLNALFAETYLTDIISRNRIKNVGEMEELVNILASNIGSMTNPAKLVNTFHSVKKSKITAGTITKYLQYLSDSFLIEGAKRYDVKGKSYIETPQKYYFTDLGLRNARINFRQVEWTHSLENIIYNELRIRGFQVDIGVVHTSEMNSLGVYERKQIEVDFVANRGDRRYYIQSAYALPDDEKRKQEFRPLMKINDGFKKVVITMDAPARLYTEEGILVMSAEDFLLHSDSLNY